MDRTNPQSARRPMRSSIRWLLTACLALLMVAFLSLARSTGAVPRQLLSASQPTETSAQQTAAAATQIAVFGTEPPGKQTALAERAAARATASALPTPAYVSAPPMVVHLAAPPASNGPPSDLTDVSFVTTRTGYGVTYSGAIYRTDDGGISWRKLYHQHSTRLLETNFISSVVGFALGESGCGEWNCTGPAVLLSTTSGGATWRSMHPAGLGCGPQLDLSPLQIAFVSAFVAFAVMDPDALGYCPALQCRLLGTVDGGRHWRFLPLPRGFSTTGGIDFPSPLRGYITGYGSGKGCASYCSQVLATQDGGRNWRVLYAAMPHSYSGIPNALTVPLYAVQFLSTKVGFIAGGFTTGDEPTVSPTRIILATHDGGATWQTLYQVGRKSWNLPVTRLHFTSASAGWISLGTCWHMGGNQPCDGPLMHTVNAGHTWTITPDLVLRFSSVGNAAWHVLLGRSGPSSGPNLLRRSLDGGSTWQTLHQPAAVVVERAQFLDAQTGWIATDVGMYKTTDGGTHWTPFAFGAPITVADWPRFLTRSTLLAFHPAGSPQQLLQSDDSGKTWRTIAVPLPRSGLYDASLATAAPKSIWLTMPTFCQSAVPCPAMLYSSTDTGHTWHRQLSNLPADHLPSLLAFGDQAHGAAATGQITSLYLTSDGGKTWIGRQLPVFVEPLSQSLSYVSAGDIWVVGTRTLSNFSFEVVLLHSLDGGRHWVLLKSAELAPSQIGFVSTRDGWLIGGSSGGNLFMTHDGGTTWRQQWVTLPPTR